MSAEPQLFRINPENRESEKIAEVEFASLGFQERRDIQEWVAANPNILGDDLLKIRSHALGTHVECRRDILTPVEDRFPPQACDLEIKSFSGIRMRGPAFKTVAID